MHPLVALVKNAVECYIRKGEVVRKPEDLAEEMAEKAGVFVCLKRGGQLRGCIGTIEPATECVASEAIRNAIASATEDPRFHPVGEHELGDLGYSVDVLYPPERIKDLSGLDPARYGVIVKKGSRRGLLLPALAGVDTAGEQMRIARMKAGISPSEQDVEIYRFEVKRFE